MITFTNLKTGEVKTAFSFRIDGEKTYITFTEGGKEYGYFSDNVKIHDEDSEFFLLYVVRSKFYNFDFTGDCQILQTVFWLYHRKGAPFHKEHLSCWFSMPWVLISR